MMVKKLRFPIYLHLLGFLPLLFACEAKQVADGEQFRQWQKSREIKRIPEEKFQAKAYELGDSVTKAVRKAWKNRIFPGDTGLASDPSACRVRQDSLAQGQVRVLEKTGIARKVFKEKERKNYLQKIREAYRYQAEKGKKPGANIQPGSGFFLYTEPVFLENRCLSCHHHSRQAQTKELQSGDLVGLWVLELSKQQMALRW